MRNSRKVTALLGSTRGENTVTESIVDYIIKETEKLQKEQLTEKKKIIINKYRVYQLFKDIDRINNLVQEIKESDLLIICSPVYVHTLPYPVTDIMEQLSNKTNEEFWQGKQMLAIIHNGYPQPIQRQASLEICENFAEQLGIEYLGGLGFGGSPIIAGRSLEEVGRFTKWMRASFDEVCKSSIIDGSEITDTAKNYADKHFPSFIPLWVLKTFMNMIIKKQARDKGIDIYSQPYLED